MERLEMVEERKMGETMRETIGERNWKKWASCKERYFEKGKGCRERERMGEVEGEQKEEGTERERKSTFVAK